MHYIYYEKNPGELDIVPINMRNNQVVVLCAVQLNSRALYFASVRMKDDRDVVLAADQQDGYVLEFESDDMKSNTVVVLWAVQLVGCALGYMLMEICVKLLSMHK